MLLAEMAPLPEATKDDHRTLPLLVARCVAMLNTAACRTIMEGPRKGLNGGLAGGRGARVCTDDVKRCLGRRGAAALDAVKTGGRLTQQGLYISRNRCHTT